MDDRVRGELIEMRSKLWVASALSSALASLAVAAPEPLAHRLEEIARAVERELSEAISSADEALTSRSPGTVAA